jgi:hypothetical protein
MDLSDSLRAVAEEHAPTLLLAVKIGPEDGGTIGSGGHFESSARDLPAHQVIHGLAVLWYLYSTVCERYADTLGVPQNQLHGLITQHYNDLKARANS